ncbi:hypothetical protein [Xenorhabdus bovienii]|uniref:hypothetical protein n=1 Tax=Xenorhabdus bovienii TaxID=40576 RepID=UPI0023B2FA4A|nr:hypothetical protein [Xenorhabdus bovienii]MDE9536892.1 hypothetical protein [Xenorhabdus bovienii]MDE9589903.1 hypothetical protein [Xenorhabdus bovienii]
MSDLTVNNLIQEWLFSDPFPGRNLRANIRGNDADQANVIGGYLGERTHDQNASGVAIFKDPKNLSTATATIMSHTQSKANFHPGRNQSK